MIMSAIQTFIEDPYQFRNVLCIYAGILKEQKELHEINCPDCEKKPCKKYYWLFTDWQEVNWKIEELERKLRKM